MGIVAGIAAVAGTAYSAYSTDKASDKAGEGSDKYSDAMGVAVSEFMSVWEGTAPKGYQTWEQYKSGGKSQIGYMPGMDLSHPLQQKFLQEMVDNGLSIKDMSDLRKLGSISAQEKFLSDKWGTDVKLNKKYNFGKIDAQIQPGGTAKEGSFAALDEIRAKGGTPSIEQQYMPWIKPGQDAYQALSKAVVEGDMSGFFTSPGYAFRLAEGEKAITRLSNAGKIPTAQAQKGLVEYGQNMASSEYGNYLGNLNSLATAGYNSLQDLKSLETYYNSSKLSATGGTEATGLNMNNYQSQLDMSAGQQYGNAISSLGNIATQTSFPTAAQSTISQAGMNSNVSTTGNMWNSSVGNMMQNQTLNKYSTSSYR